MGEQQSPINIRGAVVVPRLAQELEVRWRADQFSAAEEGHGWRFRPKGEHVVCLADREFRLDNIHFHRPSEHWVDGRARGAEMHAVHVRADDVLRACVVAVFVDLGEPGASNSKPPSGIDLPALLPDGGFHRYEGSLTTGEFDEVVSWVVMKEPVQVEDPALRAFVRAHADRARPVQPVNRRFVLSTG
ncbi:carbonic anhydrase family protein [Saccharothrix deserti]|uniref:carbonic anhydrase family protein n=1 Tax=Saccharothrix deserti TaxID=2593674 RepID=UPI00131C84A2|nr:carbonic anhydrase family protein [Saccharothrix deserti]